jgi:hypothetical protein
VISVAKDVKQSGVDQPPGTEVYLVVDQLATDSRRTWAAISPSTMHIVVRTTPPTTLASTNSERRCQIRRSKHAGPLKPSLSKPAADIPTVYV